MRSRKKRRFDNELHEFRRRLPSPVKKFHGTKLAQSGTKNLGARPVSFALKTGSTVDAATRDLEGRTIEYSMPARV
jgi:hypothetical protein